MTGFQAFRPQVSVRSEHRSLRIPIVIVALGNVPGSAIESTFGYYRHGRPELYSFTL